MSDHHETDNHHIDPLTAIAVKKNAAAGAAAILAFLGMVMILNTEDGVGRVAVFTYGVACVLAANTMIVAWGALDGHKTMTEAEMRTADILTDIGKRMARVEEAMDWNSRMLGEMIQAGGDEVAQRRRDSHDDPTPQPPGTRAHR